jgi:8-oxo-dGTP diphosphatase
MPVTYDYPRPAVSADSVVLSFDEDRLGVLLIRRGHEPFEGRWALPGGFVEMDETLEESARRELEEETGLRPAALEQLHTFGDPGRDPRGRVVTVVFLAMVRRHEHRPQAASDAAEAEWFALDELPSLAFDHDEVIATARRHLRDRARLGPFGLELLPARFGLDQLQALYEQILGRKLNATDFARWISETGLVVDSGPAGGDASSRFGFDRERYEHLSAHGFRALF